MASFPGGISAIEREIYDRNMRIPEIGEEGQLRLARAKVLIVGLGGLGSPALYYLAAAGIGQMGIADGDSVELSNLQRQILHGRADVGLPKTASAARRIAALRPDLRLEGFPLVLDEKNAREVIAPYDFVIEATDNFTAKFLINDVCVRLGKPFCHAGILGMFGQVLTVWPGRGPCFRCVFGEAPRPGEVPTTAEVGVLGAVPGVLGAIQAAEAIKFVVGCGRLLIGRLLTFDALEMTFREVELPREGRCSLCREAGDDHGRKRRRR